MADYAPVAAANLLAEAERRYLHDAEFHYKVEQAMRVLAWDLRQRSGFEMGRADRSLARLAASVALLVPGFAPAPETPPLCCDNCGQSMSAHGALANCWPVETR